MTESNADGHWSWIQPETNQAKKKKRTIRKVKRDETRQRVTDNKKQTFRGGENRQRQADKGKAEEKDNDRYRKRQSGQVETQTDRQTGRKVDSLDKPREDTVQLTGES